MDDLTQKHDSGADDEKDFAETLVNAPDLIEEKSKEDSKSAVEGEKTKQPLWAGKIMGHFKLLRLIGKGAMGIVIQAEDTQLKRIVALKVLRKKLTKGEKGQAAVNQFLREARAAASIEHPNIVRVYEINQHSGWWYIAMEMVSGNSLLDIVKAAGALSASRACPIIADAATALNVAHEIGMVHRDIKPSNILVTRNGRGKISDFGLVRIEDPNDPFDIYADQSIGTPLYMAPEIIRRESIGPAVDIYSLGATLYYTLTGRPPYMAKEMRDVLKKQLHADPPDIQSYLPNASPNLATLIKRMMSKQPDTRPTASEVAAILNAESITFFAEGQRSGVYDASTISMELQALQQGSRTAVSDLTQLSGQKTRARQTKRRAWFILLASALIVVLCGLSLQYFMTRIPKQDRRDVVKLFPQAPAGYGTRQPGDLPLSSALTEIPSFSWKGKVDTTDIKFVASRSGRYYYPITDTRALLIRAEEFVGYKTADQAAQDDKKPAP